MPFSNTITLANTFSELVDLTNQIAAYINDNLVSLVPGDGLSVNGTLFVNSTATFNASILVGANVSVNTSVIKIGNTTVNTTVNSSSLAFNSVVVANSTLVTIPSVNASVSINSPAIYSNALVAGRVVYASTNGLLATDTGMLWNDASNLLTLDNIFASLTLQVGANVTVNTTLFAVGNSTVNTTINSTAHMFNGTLFANSSIINIPTVNAAAHNGATMTLSTSATVGANAVLGVADLKIGNSTVNTTLNSSSFLLNGVVIANTTILNNPTHNGATIALTTSATVGANVTLGVADLKIGNSTVNTTHNSSTLAFNGTLVVNSSILNIATVNAPTINASTITAAGAISAASLTASSLTAGRVAYASTAGLLATDAGLVFNDVTNTLTVGVLASDGGITAVTTIAVGANAIVNTSSFFVGNSTVNTIVTGQTTIIPRLGVGVTVPIATDGYITVPAAGRLAFQTRSIVGSPANGHTYLLASDESAGVRLDHSVTGVLRIRNTGDSADGNLTINFVTANGLTTNSLAVGANVTLLTDGLRVGNSTVNTTFKSTDVFFNGVLFANATLVSSPTVNAATFNAATLALTTSVAVGANVTLSTGVLSIGNSTVNTTINSTAHLFNGTLFANSTIINIPTINAATHNGSTLVLSTSATVGANVVLGVSDLKIGNSTVNTTVNSSTLAYNGTLIANSTLINIPTINAATHNGATLTLGTSATVGANVTLSTVALLIGNSTVNSTMNSSVVNTASINIRTSAIFPAVAGISANGSFGIAGDVLTSNGTAIYWTASVGGAGFDAVAAALIFG